MVTHEWGPSRLNHGNQQCIHCHCTDLEALHALGQECKANPRHPMNRVNYEPTGGDNVLRFPIERVRRHGGK